MFLPSLNDFKAYNKVNFFLVDLLGVTRQLLSFQTIASLCGAAMEKKYIGKDNLNLAKLVVLWKFRFTSGASPQTGPGLFPMYRPRPAHDF